MDPEFWVAVAAVLLSAVALVRGELHQRRRVSQDAQFRAVEKVVEALQPVYLLLEHADTRLPAPSEISDVMHDFERECQRWEPTLPPGAKHLRISVRQALANCFGPPAAIAVDPEAASHPMATFDKYWSDQACTYVEHVHHRLGAWQVQERRRPIELVHFAQWRREEDNVHRRVNDGRSGSNLS
jgi:hypothetical protein